MKTLTKYHTLQALWPAFLLFFHLLLARPASAYYDPGVQRWLNRDPLGEPGFEFLKRSLSTKRDRIVRTDPLGNVNLYGFAENSALNRIDPNGLELFPPMGPKSPLGTPGVPCNMPCKDFCGIMATAAAGGCGLLTHPAAILACLTAAEVLWAQCEKLCDTLGLE